MAIAETVPLDSPAAARVFVAVLTEGPLSRVDVGRRTGLSSGAVSRAVRPLLDAGYLVERADGRAGAGLGRPANPLEVDSDRAFFVGIKVTGDELIGVVTDLRARIRSVRHLPLRARDVDTVVTAAGRVVNELQAAAGGLGRAVRQLGLAVSGDVDSASGLVRYSPFLGWRDVPLAALAERATGLATVVENDVRALTVAEQWFGAGVGASTFALVTVGAGIGCGLVVNGAVVSGAHGVAGELGHVPIETEGPPCHCGGRGCVEAIAADPAIVRQVRAATRVPDLTAEDAVALARAGDGPSRAVFARAGHAIGLALAAVANLVGPERIVISGEGLAAYDLLEDQIREAFAAQAFGAVARCELIVRPLPFEEWARGAAAVAIQRLVAP
jgi:predicted NBD/HSP70 family sugar kinase